MSSKSREQPTYQLIELRLKFVIGVDKLPPFNDWFRANKGRVNWSNSVISNVVYPTIATALWHNSVHHTQSSCAKLSKNNQSVEVLKSIQKYQVVNSNLSVGLRLFRRLDTKGGFVACICIITSWWIETQTHLLWADLNWRYYSMVLLYL